MSSAQSETGVSTDGLRRRLSSRRNDGHDDSIHHSGATPVVPLAQSVSQVALDPPPQPSPPPPALSISLNLAQVGSLTPRVPPVCHSTPVTPLHRTRETSVQPERVAPLAPSMSANPGFGHAVVQNTRPSVPSQGDGLPDNQIDSTAYVCNWKYCDRTFLSLVSFVRHVQTAHGPGAGYKCEQCDRVFSRQDALMRHIRNAHGPPEVRLLWKALHTHRLTFDYRLWSREGGMRGI